MQYFYDFIDYFSFTFELLSASMFFALYFERRKLFLLRFILGLAAMMAVAYFWKTEFSYAGIAGNIFKYETFYVMAIFIMFFSFRSGFWGALFCATVGYCVQHITYNFYRLLSLIPPFFSAPATYFVHIGWFFLVYAALLAVLRIFYKQSKEIMRESLMRNKSLLIVGAIFITVATFLDNIALLAFAYDGAWDLIYFVHLFLSIITGFILYIEFSALQARKTQNELANLKLILHSQHKIYNSNKEMIESINLKCHDLKHQINSVKSRLSEGEIQDMSRLIAMYDSSLYTDNEAIDIVLAEKSVYCVNRGITLTCLLNGKHLSRMSDYDLYSFFGNAIDNAIEAVFNLPEEKRFISITENIKSGLLNIRIENYCDGNITFSDGLPQTTKNKVYHGFGMKSMRHIVEKYDGQFSCKLEGELFVVNIFLPFESEGTFKNDKETEENEGKNKAAA